MSIFNVGTYHRPEDLDEALRLLREGKGRAFPLAGGTSLLGKAPHDIEALVDLSELPFDWISSRESRELSLGAAVTLANLLASDRIRDYAGGILARATRHEAANLVRNRATLGGTLVARSASSDLVTLLATLEATIVLNDGEQVVPIDEFYRRRDYHLQPGALITEVLLPPLEEGDRVALERISRTPMDQSILSLAVRVRFDGDSIQSATVAVGAIDAVPQRLTDVEAALSGTQIASETFETAIAAAAEGVQTREDHLASAVYRAAMIPVLIRRAIDAASAHPA